MSTVSYLFGNVDDSGKLDKKQLDASLRETLEIVEESSEYLTAILNHDVGVDLSISKDRNDAYRIQPQKDAIDYSEILEVIEVELPAPMLYLPPQSHQTPVVIQAQPIRPSLLPKKTLTELFPSYVPGGRLKFSELFASKVAKSYPYIGLNQVKKGTMPITSAQTDTHYELAASNVDVFLQPQPPRFSEVAAIEVEYIPTKEQTQGSKISETEIPDLITHSALNTAAFDPVVLEHWENNIVWEDDADEDMTHHNVPKYL